MSISALGCAGLLAGCGHPGGTREDDAGAGCSEANVDACEYPSRGLDYETTPREAGSVLHVMDELTGRVLPIVVYVPEGDGPFPVVVFSHGGGFSEGQNNSRNWGSELAAHGYVAIHYGSVEPDDTALTAYCDLADLAPEECTPGGVDGEATVLIGRSRDIIAVLDSLDELSDGSVARGGPALDVERVAIVGWSGGARSGMPLMGATAIVSPTVQRFTQPDPRPRAAIFLSPSGPDFGGFFDDGTETSWDALRGPTLIATGENDVKPDNPELTGPIRRFPFDAQPADGERHLLYSNLAVGVGGHGTYDLEDLGSSDERLSRLSRAISSVARAFLDAYVLEDEEARAWLESDNARILAGDAEWSHR